jgi:hypothetical protein
MTLDVVPARLTAFRQSTSVATRTLPSSVIGRQSTSVMRPSRIGREQQISHRAVGARGDHTCDIGMITKEVATDIARYSGKDDGRAGSAGELLGDLFLGVVADGNQHGRTKSFDQRLGRFACRRFASESAKTTGPKIRTYPFSDESEGRRTSDRRAQSNVSVQPTPHRQRLQHPSPREPPPYSSAASEMKPIRLGPRLPRRRHSIALVMGCRPL